VCVTTRARGRRVVAGSCWDRDTKSPHRIGRNASRDRTRAARKTDRGAVCQAGTGLERIRERNRAARAVHTYCPSSGSAASAGPPVSPERIMVRTERAHSGEHHERASSTSVLAKLLRNPVEREYCALRAGRRTACRPASPHGDCLSRECS
jgi:hypothetical protein